MEPGFSSLFFSPRLGSVAVGAVGSHGPHSGCACLLVVSFNWVSLNCLQILMRGLELPFPEQGHVLFFLHVLFFTYVHVCVCVSICHMRVGTRGSRKRTSDPLGLDHHLLLLSLSEPHTSSLFLSFPVRISWCKSQACTFSASSASSLSTASPVQGLSLG